MKTTYKGYNAGSGASPAIWADCPIVEMLDDTNQGYHFFDDFLNFGGVVASNVGSYGPGYKSYEDNSASILQIEEVGGVARLATPATDNNQVTLQAGYTGGAPFLITATDKQLWFEARIRPQQIVTQDFFIGLAEKTQAVVNFISDADVIADKDWLGFQVLTATPDTWDAVYHKNGQGGAGVLQKQTAGKSTSNVWIKLGMVWKPGVGLTYFINGVQVGALLATLSATTFPTKKLSPIISIKNSAGAITQLDIDWWRCAQLRA